jgi:hypothetical protein
MDPNCPVCGSINSQNCYRCRVRPAAAEPKDSAVHRAAVVECHSRIHALLNPYLEVRRSRR